MKTFCALSAVALCLGVAASGNRACGEETVLRAIAYAPPNKVEDGAR